MSYRIPPETRIGSIELAVPEPDNVAEFYRQTVGLVEIDRDDETVTLGVETSPLITLTPSSSAATDPNETTGLYHTAIRVPDRQALSAALTRTVEADVLDGASDHGFSEALYFRDPAGNGLEIYCDRPEDEWPWQEDGHMRSITQRLDIDSLRDLEGSRQTVPPGTDIGHVHLAVSDVDRSLRFYRDTVGFELTMRPMAAAAFLAAGGYHHHIGMNTWERRREPASGPGLTWYEIVLPDVDSRDALLHRIAEAGVAIEHASDVPEVADPDGIGIRLRTSA